MIVIHVTKSYLPDINKYQSYVREIFESGFLTNNGRIAQELKLRLSNYFNVRNLVLVSNGTLALQIAYKLLGLQGDVLTTPFSFVATTSSLVWEGLNPVFVDIDENTLTIDAAKIEEKITAKTTAIVATHVYANPCDIERIEAVANKYQLKVVYDAAHAFGVRYRDRNLLECGDISIISFHSTKVFHTVEGGALVIHDDALYERALRMINFGIEGPERIVDLGINAKMNEFQAAMGLCVLDDFDEILTRRRAVWLRYIRGLEDVRRLRFPQLRDHATRNYSHFPVVFQDEQDLLQTSKELKRQGFHPRRYFYPSLETLPYVQPGQTVPKANDVSRTVLCLPMYDGLPTDAQEQIVDIVRECLL